MVMIISVVSFSGLAISPYIDKTQQEIVKEFEIHSVI